MTWQPVGNCGNETFFICYQWKENILDLDTQDCATTTTLVTIIRGWSTSITLKNYFENLFWKIITKPLISHSGS